jgi:large repetitive protein
MSIQKFPRSRRAIATRWQRRFPVAYRQSFEPLESRCLLSAGPPVISISDVTQQEGHSGTTQFVFVVTLSTPSDAPIKVKYATAGHTARAVRYDFIARHGSLTFAAGETSKTITVNVRGDKKTEADEFFYLNLTSPARTNVGPTFDKSQGVGTILNDDAWISIGNVNIIEGKSDVQNAVVEVRLNFPSTRTVSVYYQTVDGTATSGSDYDAISGKLTFAPGETSKTIQVPVRGDVVEEADEYFQVMLKGVRNAKIANDQGYIAVWDNRPRFSVSSESVLEGTSTSLMTFTVLLRALDEPTLTVDFATRDNSAYAGQDYVANSGTLTFAPGETTKTFTVEIIADGIPEYDEDFLVELSGASGNALNLGIGFGSILDVYGQFPTGDWGYYDPYGPYGAGGEYYY